MTWIEVRYRRLYGEAGETPGPWESLPRVPDGTKRFRTPGLILGATYEAWYRRVDDMTGEAEEWIPMGTAVIGFTNPAPAAVDELRVVCGENLTWDPPLNIDGPSGLRFRVLHAPGDWRHAPDMVPAVSDWPAAPPFDLCLVPRGRRTLAVVPVDPEGQEGEPAYVLTNRGDFDDADPVEGRETTIVPVPLTHPFTVIEGAGVNGAGHVVQQQAPGGTVGARPFYIGEGNAPFYRGEPSDPFYVTSFLEATVTFRHVNGPLDGGYDLEGDHAVLTIALEEPAGVNWRIEYRRNAAPFYVGTGESPFYVGGLDSKFRRGLDGSSPFYGAGGDPFYVGLGSDPFYGIAAWRPWPGKLRDLPRTRMDVRIVIPASWRQTILRALALRETFQPRMERELATIGPDGNVVQGSDSAGTLDFGGEGVPTSSDRPVDGNVLVIKDGEIRPVTTVPTWQSFQITRQDFAVGALNSSKQVAYVRGRVVIHETVVEVLEEWSGGGSSSVLLDLGDLADPEGLLADFEMAAAAGTFTREPSGKLHNVQSGTKILAAAECDVNLILLTQGRSVIRLLVSSME